MPQRLFIALELPETTCETLAGLDPGIRGLSWVPVDNMHLTLSFLGDVADTDEEPLRAELSTVHVPPFFLPIQGVGAFGGARPRALWAGVGHGHPHLFALHKHIQDAVLRARLEPDLNPFHPHITLARPRDISRQTLQPFLKKHAETEFDLLHVTAFTLMSSHLGRPHPIYTAEARFPFRTPHTEIRI